MVSEYSVRPSIDQNQYGNCTLESAVIHNSSTPLPNNVNSRFTIEDISLSKCKHWACHLRGSILKNIQIHKLTGGKGMPTFLWGCVYNNVKLEGEISGLMFRWQVSTHDKELSKVFNQYNQDLYLNIPLALDISEAKFTFFQSIQGVPSSLVKRNPEWHFIVNKESALHMSKSMEEFGVWSFLYEELEETGLQDTVVVLSQKGKSYKKDKEFALDLKDRGLIK